MKTLITSVEALGVVLMLFSSLVLFYLICLVALVFSIFSKPVKKEYLIPEDESF